MSGLQITGIIVSAVCSISHLVSTLTDNSLFRRITKPLCMGSLIFLLFTFGLKEWVIYAAVMSALLGDIFLMWSSNMIMFAVGTLFFGISHGLYISRIIYLIGSSGLNFYLIMGALYIVFLIGAGSLLMKKIGTKAFLGSSYFGILLLELSFIIYYAVKAPSLGIFIALFGSIFHTLSDLILSLRVLKIIRFKKSRFLTMLTYIIGQYSIALGIFML
jgi:hypothetical protein